MQRDVTAALDGALGGGIGTVGMSALMLAAGKMGLMGEQPPDKIAGTALDAIGAHARDEKAQDALATLLHFAFGVGCGTIFAAIHRRLPFRLPAALHGVIFASLVWAASYEGWVPALGILPPASRDDPGRTRVMFLSHVIYGALLGTVVGRRTED